MGRDTGEYDRLVIPQLRVSWRLLLAWGAATYAAGLVLAWTDASQSIYWTVFMIVLVTGLPNIMRAVDDRKHPQVDVPVLKLGYRQRRWPQLLASIDADNRR